MMSIRSERGQWTPWTEISEEVKKICEEVKADVEKNIGKTLPTYAALNSRVKSLLGGTHYEIKVYVGDDTLLILRVVQVIVHHPPPPKFQFIIKFPLPGITIIPEPQ